MENENFIYFDVLDTARTGGYKRQTQEEAEKAHESICLGRAELAMALLRGLTPVFPQTFGWDSTALLNYAAEKEGNGAAFKWLLTKGFIRVRLFDRSSILEAALAAFQDPAYSMLEAWPGFDTPEKRKPLVEAIRTKKAPAALADHVGVGNRLELLRELSAAVGEAPKARGEQRRENRLRAAIEHAHAAASRYDPTIADLLCKCTQLPDPNNRTAIYTFLDEQEAAGRNVPPEVRDIIDACFNAVAAWCVGANAGLTTPRSQCSSSVAVDILHESLPGSVRNDVFEAPVEELRPKNISELEVVNWTKIREFLRENGDLPMSEKERQAEAAKLIAEVVVEQRRRRYALVIKGANFLGQSLLWGGAAGVGGILASVWGAIVFSGLAGGLGTTLNFGSFVRTPLQKRLERKWNGLLQSQSDREQKQVDGQIAR
ncbi:MAG: hypothetical protein ABSD31_09685 [Candidatus Binataceae bacterium]